MPAIRAIASHTARYTIRGRGAAILDDAEDVAQRVVIACWQRPDVPDKPTAFVTLMARHRAIDHVSKGYSKRRVRSRAAADAYHGAVDHAPDALRRVLARHESDRLRVALRALPDHMRRPLELHALHRQPLDEIAPQFGCSARTLAMRLTRARKVLAQLMEGDVRRPLRRARPASVRTARPVVRRAALPTDGPLHVHACVARHFDIGTSRPFDVLISMER